MSCQHGWNPPAGVACPECAWDSAAKVCGSDCKAGIEIVREGVRAAALMMPTPEQTKHIMRIAKTENNYHAIKVARELRQKFLAGR